MFVVFYVFRVNAFEACRCAVIGFRHDAQYLSAYSIVGDLVGKWYVCVSAWVHVCGVRGRIGECLTLFRQLPLMIEAVELVIVLL